MNKLLVIAIILYLFDFQYAQSEAVKKILSKADSLFLSENYFDAITEYKRAVFFDSNKTVCDRINYQIGLCYKAGGYFENAVEFFGKAILSSRDENLKLKSKIQIARCLMLNKETEAARNLLINLSDEYSELKNYWIGWTRILEGDFSSAKENLKTSYNFKELYELINKFENEEDCSMLKFFSYIAPNIVYLYFGEYFSFLLSTFYIYGSAYLTFQAFEKEKVIEGLAIANLLLARFYSGSIQNNLKAIEDLRRKKIIQNLDYLQKAYKGEKP